VEEIEKKISESLDNFEEVIRELRAEAMQTSDGSGTQEEDDANSTLSGDGIPFSKRRRRRFPLKARDFLLNWFHENVRHPYPTEEDMERFVKHTELTKRQISHWFTNHRKRVKRQRVFKRSPKPNKRLRPRGRRTCKRKSY